MMQPPPQQQQQQQLSERPKVGVGVIVLSSIAQHNNTVRAAAAETQTPSSYIWVGRRKGSHGSSKLALPGGHLEYHESWSECAIREVQEEMGITLKDVEFLHVTNDIMIHEEKHYVTIFMISQFDIAQQQPINQEPDKCAGWEAYTLPQLRSMIDSNELFLPLENLLKENPVKLQTLCMQ
jgi:8-oxo-dGTP diphosphatase